MFGKENDDFGKATIINRFICVKNQPTIWLQKMWNLVRQYNDKV